MTKTLDQSRCLAIVTAATAFALSLPSASWLWPCPSSHFPPWAAHTLAGPAIACFVTVAFLAPGLAISALRKDSMTLVDWVVGAGFWSAIWHVGTGLASGAMMTGVSAESRSAIEAGWTLALPAIAWAFRMRKPGAILSARSELAALLGVAGMLACGLGPALWSREFSSDGLESYVLGRGLDLNPFPLFLTPTGGAGLGSGGWLQAYLIHALFPLVGDAESTPRFLLIVAAPVVTAVAHRSAERILGRSFSMGLGLPAVVTIGLLLLALHASFDLHITDPSSPAAWDAVGAALLIALVGACFSGSMLEVVAIATLCALARPSGPLVAAAVGFALVAMRPIDVRYKLLRLLVALLASVIVVMLIENYLVTAIRPGSDEFLASGGLKTRLRALTFQDQGRWFWVIAASGGGAILVAARCMRSSVPKTIKSVGIAAAACAGLFTITRGFAPHHMMPAVSLVWLATAALLADARLLDRFFLLLGLLIAVFLGAQTYRQAPSKARDLGAAISVDRASITPDDALPSYLRSPFPPRLGWSAFSSGRGTLLSTESHRAWLLAANHAAAVVRSPFSPTESSDSGIVTMVPILPAIYAHATDPGTGDLVRLDATGAHFDSEAMKDRRSIPYPVTPVARSLRVPQNRLFPLSEPKVGVDCDVDLKIWWQRLTGR